MNTRLAAELRTEADLKAIAKRQKEFEAAVKAGNHLQMSETNKQFHMAIAKAGRIPISPRSTSGCSIRVSGCSISTSNIWSERTKAIS